MAWWLSPLRPLAIGVLAFAVALVIANQTLPLHTVLIWDTTGRRALAASQSDFEVGVLIAAFVVLGIYLVSAVLMAVTPVRHVLVPHAAYWKSNGRHREMRHRYATYLGRAFGATYWFFAVEILVAVVSQTNKVLEVWWLPAIISLLFIVILLIFAVWVFTDGFRPPPASTISTPSRRA